MYNLNVKQKVFTDIVCFDICLDLFKYFDISDFIHFFILSKDIYYYVYLQNRHYFNKLLINKILKYFYFERRLNLETCDLDSISIILFKIYKHFKHHRCSHRIDFLLYILENQIDCDILFEYYANFCKFDYKFNTDNLTRTILLNDVDNVDTETNFKKELSNISISDMKYILIYSNTNQLRIILRIFTIPVSILSYTIDELLLNNDDEKIGHIIDYMFYRFCFGSFDDLSKMYVHKIIICLIKNKKTALFQQFLLNKRYYFKGNYILDYQELVNNTIDLQDRPHLNMLLQEIKHDNKRLVKNNINPVFVIINTHLVIDMCKKARFMYLKYIIDNILGDSINYELYIQSICEGIQVLLHKEPQEIKRIQCLSPVLTDKNKQLINKYLDNLYKSENIKIDFFIM